MGSYVYDTNSTAKRDDNTISMSAQRTWEIWLESTSHTFPRYNTGYGYGSSQGGYSGYAWAACTRSSSVNGQCYTHWHD